jgi:hypothetical protein
LKDGVDPAIFEQWVLSVDYPTMRGLSRVSSFSTHRVRGLLMGDGTPSADYVEIFDIPDLEGFISQDMGTTIVRNIMGQFMGFAAGPEFLIVDELQIPALKVAPSSKELALQAPERQEMPSRWPRHIAGRSTFGWIVFTIYMLLFLTSFIMEMNTYFELDTVKRGSLASLFGEIFALVVMFAIPYWFIMWFIYYAPRWVQVIATPFLILFSIFGGE